MGADNIETIWNAYWGMAVGIWILLWLGLRRWVWWGITLVIMAAAAGVLFTMIPISAESSELAPAFMVVLFELLNDASKIPMTAIWPMAKTGALVGGIFLICQLAKMFVMNRLAKSEVEEPPKRRADVEPEFGAGTTPQ